MNANVMIESKSFHAHIKRITALPRRPARSRPTMFMEGAVTFLAFPQTVTLQFLFFIGRRYSRITLSGQEGQPLAPKVS